MLQKYEGGDLKSIMEPVPEQNGDGETVFIQRWEILLFLKGA